MGFYATALHSDRPSLVPGQPVTPSKNRVWDFFETSQTRARLSASQPVGLHQTTRDTSTKTVSGRANGNITDYVDAGGAVVAHREYDPFGNTVKATGSMVNDFHHWFSSKYLDAETGLYYYGYRFYSPTLSKWVSRDPIEEIGFAVVLPQEIVDGITDSVINSDENADMIEALYAFVDDKTPNKVDILGLAGTPGGCTVEGDQLVRELLYDNDKEAIAKHNQDMKKGCEALSDVGKSIILTPIKPGPSASTTSKVLTWIGKKIVGFIWKKTDPGEKIPNTKPICEPKK